MKWLLPAALGLALSCGRGATPVARDVDGRVTVTHGVYGQTVFWNDTDTDGPYALAGYEFDVTFVNSSMTVPVVTDDVGFYQLALDAGTYSICTIWNDCDDFTVPASGVIRLDYDGGASSKLWHTVTPTGSPDAGT